MKIAPKAVKEFIAYPQKFSGALIYGADEGQVRKTVRDITENFMGKDAEAINRVEFNYSQIADDPARLADELASLSLLGGKRVVCIRDAEDALATLLNDALTNQAPENFFIAYCNEALGAKSKLRSAFERHDTLACVACYQNEGANLTALIRDTLKAYGIRTDRETLDYLGNALRGDQQVVLNELEKISLYLGNDTQLTMEQALLLISDGRESSLDELTHAVAGDNRVAICTLTDTLLAESVQPVVIIRSLMRYLRRLSQVAQMRYNGMQLDQAIASLKPPVFFKHKTAFRHHASRWGLSKIQDALYELQKLELSTKQEAALTRSLLCAGLLRVAALPNTGRAKRAA